MKTPPKTTTQRTTVAKTPGLETNVSRTGTKRKSAKKQPKRTFPLSVRQQMFAEFVASGMPAMRAYEKAGYVGGDNAEAHASRLVENGGVKALIEKLRTKNAERFELKRDVLARHLLAAVMTPIGEFDADSPLAGEMTEDIIGGGNRGKLRRGNKPSGNEIVEEIVTRRRVKSMGKVESARLLCEMMGWKEPEKHVVEAGPNTLEAIKAKAAGMALGLAREITDSQ